MEEKLQDELRKAKKVCEEKILIAIVEFEKETGLRVSYINYDETENVTGIKKRSVELDLKL